ncbi:hypothetical protein BDV27DRAFT_128422 [Aspergillus caelatus]|uniref:Antifungal protein n=1 Tax=Aspergillus caelatus TaxID=61420 RepID=A0A5N7A7F2_9EURO|nr:uncharacterized protein BDV27DRAFT_128422 [Aspergillus caelatus]KAE8364470.1 hypothetical protein BDV27DRAFT_128422 [Aspergillus caelatus]
MKAFTLTSFGLALSAALGVLASPASSGSPTSNDLDVRNEDNRQVRYPGDCDPKTNQCHYKSHSGPNAICRCDFKICTDAVEDKGCYYDSYTRKCVCQDVVKGGG